MDDPIDRLIAAVKKSGLRQTHVARLAHLHRTKLNKILKRNQVPTVPEFIDISRAIQLDPALLFTEGDLVVKLDALRDAHAATQRATDILARWLPEATPQRVEPRPEPLALPKHAVSARFVNPVHAAANPNAELLVEFEEQQKEIPRRAWNRGARIIARAVGESMDGGDDPIHDGALVFLKPTRSTRTANRRIALVRRDDGLYLKRFETESGHTIRLVSMNGEPAIVIDVRGENMQIYGYVVDHE
jgi:lambda repressor-like predicted transcriptional regulator